MIPNYRITLYLILILDIAILIGFLELREKVKTNELVDLTKELCIDDKKDSDLCSFLTKAYP